jgi:hypothetical protein
VRKILDSQSFLIGLCASGRGGSPRARTTDRFARPYRQIGSPGYFHQIRKLIALAAKHSPEVENLDVNLNDAGDNCESALLSIVNDPRPQTLQGLQPVNP